MVYYKTQEEIELIRESSLLVSKTHAAIVSAIKPGVTGIELDRIAEEFIKDHKAVPGFKGYRGFPASLCISINEVVVHGIPNGYEFLEGDIISIDCGVLQNGFYGDSAYTYILDGVEKEVERLCKVTYESLFKGIEKAVVGNRIGDISHAIQSYTENENGFSVVRELVGHGVGKNLHESPEVPNFGRRGRGSILKKGLVIAIEPMINQGTKKVVQGKDGWTISTKDKLPSAHYEHTVAVLNGQADILSDHRIIEQEIKKNANIKDISRKK